MSDLRELDPSLDVDPETGKPYEDGLAVEILEPQVTITSSTPVPYTVTGPSGNS